MRVVDQMLRQIEIPATPRRIISVVPSQSEFLWDLGLRAEITGITKFCIHPDELFKSATRIGGTKKLNIEKIRSLQPDLIIGNKEENERSDIEALEKEFPVWMSDIYTLDDAFEMMRRLGIILDRSVNAEKIISSIREKAKVFDRTKNVSVKKRVAYFIWKDPFMVAGENNFIDHMLQRCGFKNIFGEIENKKVAPGKNTRYPEISLKELRSAQPDLILLSSEPYPFSEKHIAEFKNACPTADVLIVDGEMFSWYGSRLQHAFPYLASFMKTVAQ